MYRAHHCSSKWLITGLALVLVLLAGATAKAEDGYRLWLRYHALPKAMSDGYRARVTAIIVSGKTATLDAIRAELVNGCTGLLGARIPTAENVDRDGAVIVGTPQSSPLVASLHLQRQMAELGQ